MSPNNEGPGSSPSSDSAARRLRWVFVGATALTVALLAFFAYSLAHSQQQQRQDLEKRFKDRADVSAALTGALFAIGGQQGQVENAVKFGGAKIDPAALAATARRSRALYAEVIGSDGRVLAATPHAPPRMAVAPYVAKALATGKTQLSNLLPGPHGVFRLDYASPFPTTHGRRVEVNGLSGKFLAQFLGGFLNRVPNVSEARSYIIDGNGKVVGASGLGKPLPEAALAAAVAKGKQGSYDDNRYFTSAAIEGSPWRIVLSTAKDKLYATVNGSQRTVSWIIFAAFVLAAGLGLFLLRRVLVANSQLERAELSRRHAVEINDNIVQRLVLAKLALERGATETSREKLAETLTETQQLVTSLLDEKEIKPGSLRRAGPARTEGPPEPPSAASKR